MHSFCNVEEVGTGQPASSLQCPNRTVPSVMKTQQVQCPAEKGMTSVLYFMLHPVIPYNLDIHQTNTQHARSSKETERNVHNVFWLIWMRDRVTAAISTKAGDRILHNICHTVKEIKCPPTWGNTLPFITIWNPVVENTFLNMLTSTPWTSHMLE